MNNADLVWPALLWVLQGCVATDGGNGKPVSAGGGGIGGTAGAEFGASGSPSTAGGMTGSGGTQAISGSGGMGGDAGGTAGSAGQMLGAAGSPLAPEEPQRFECTLVLGFNITADWFDAGFEGFVDGDRWEIKGVHDAMIEYWANPQHEVWREDGCHSAFSPCQTKSRCTTDSGPDRILLVAQSDQLRAPAAATTQAGWEAGISSALATIRAKYPTARRIELMTFPRSPEGSMCGGHADIPPNHDAAQVALAESSNGAVTVAPRFRVMDCGQFTGFPPYMNAAGYAYVAELIGAHYAAEEQSPDK